MINFEQSGTTRWLQRQQEISHNYIEDQQRRRLLSEASLALGRTPEGRRFLRKTYAVLCIIFMLAGVLFGCWGGYSIVGLTKYSEKNSSKTIGCVSGVALILFWFGVVGAVGYCRYKRNQAALDNNPATQTVDESKGCCP